MRQIPVLGLLVLLLGAPIPAVARSATPAAAPPAARSAIAWEPCPLPEAATPVPAPPRMAGTVDEPTVK